MTAQQLVTKASSISRMLTAIAIADEPQRGGATGEEK
jgi:hypothetical protein